MKKLYLVLLLILLTSIPLQANMIWPSIYIAQGTVTLSVITVGLIVEWGVLKIFFKEGWLKCLIMSLTMNLFSTVIGILWIPISGIFGEIFLLPFETGTFHISHLILDFLLAVFCNVIIEGLVLRYIFKKKSKKLVVWLFIANFISISICIIKIYPDMSIYY